MTAHKRALEYLRAVDRIYSPHEVREIIEGLVELVPEPPPQFTVTGKYSTLEEVKAATKHSNIVHEWTPKRT